MALTIATGFVVDDAIVVIENITRHIENGMKPMQAALKGARRNRLHGAVDEHLAHRRLHSDPDDERHRRPPVPRIRGDSFGGHRHLDGGLAHRDADDVRVAAQGSTSGHGYLYNQSEKFYRWVISTYGAALDVVLDHPASILLTVVLTLGVNVYLYVKVPKGFFPQQDTGRLHGNVVGEQHISYQALVEKAKWFEEQVRTDPDVETVTMVAGTSGGGFGGNSANINVQLKPSGVRKATSDQVIARLRRKTSGMPGATMFLQNSQDVRIGGRQGNAQYQYTLQAPDFASLALWGPKVLDRLSTLPEIADVSSDQQNSGLVVERDHRSRYRVAPRPDGAGRGRGALRRLRPAPGLGDVQVDQSVSRGPRAAAAMVGEPRLPEHDLRADAERHRRAACRPSRTSRRESRRSRCRTRASFRRRRFRSISRKTSR